MGPPPVRLCSRARIAASGSHLGLHSCKRSKIVYGLPAAHPPTSPPFPIGLLEPHPDSPHQKRHAKTQVSSNSITQ
jgi:hypothetical protein